MRRLSDPRARQLAGRFRALAEPLRLRLLHRLQAGEESVGALAEAVGTSQANASKHLQLLLAAGFVARRKDGVTAWYRVADDRVFTLCTLVCD